MKTLAEINQEWAPLRWIITQDGDGYRALAAIHENVLLEAQINSDEEGDLYAFRVCGTAEAIKNFILNRKA